MKPIFSHLLQSVWAAKRQWQAILLIIVIYFLLRGVFIARFPLFFDEAIYIHWAQAVAKDWSWRFVSLIDGKQPLMIWIISFFLKIIPNPIIAGRLVSLLAGVISMLSLCFLGKKLFNLSTGLIAASFYLLIPFFLIYDGLALMDGLLLLLCVLSCYTAVVFVTTKKFKYAVFQGIIIGLGLLTKSSAIFFFIASVASCLFIERNNQKHWLWWGLGTVTAFILSKVIESVLRFSIYFLVIAGKNHDFIFTFSEVLAHPFQMFSQNFSLISSWYLGYLGVPFLLWALISLIVKDKRKEKVFLLVQFLIPVTAMLFFGKAMYPRYFLFMTWPLCLLAGSMIDSIATRCNLSRYVPVLLYLGIISPFIYTNYFLLKDFQKAPLPQVERWQLIDGGPSGVGLDQMITYFRQFEQEKLTILTDQYIGILPDGIALHFAKQNNIQVVGLSSVTKSEIMTAFCQHKPERSFIVLSSQTLPGDMEAGEKLVIKREGKQNTDWKVMQLNTEGVNCRKYGY